MKSTLTNENDIKSVTEWAAENTVWGWGPLFIAFKYVYLEVQEQQVILLGLLVK